VHHSNPNSATYTTQQQILKKEEKFFLTKFFSFYFKVINKANSEQKCPAF
jgi:hypothetical protein